MSWTAALTLAVPAAVAVVGYFATYFNNLHLARRKDHLDRLNRQLAEFYGPLYALSASAESAWQMFRSIYRPEVGPFWGTYPPPSDAEAAAWRLWMRTVFMPLNRQMRDVVIRGTDLVEDDELPSCLLDLANHVAAYEAVIQGWQDGDYSDHYGPSNYPVEVATYAAKRFKSLKLEQARLLRRQI
jgi:hypothetical protein